MDLRPWDYWTADGQPQEGIAEALALLERVVAEDPTHPGACHFYIHAVEKVYPERAVACAERLAGLMPGAGHLVHMPGHIYVRVGRYLDAVEANQHAVHADETYIQDQQPLPGMYAIGYYPHNYDFMAFAAMMIGRSAESIDAATRVSSLLPPELLGAPGMDFVQHWSIRPHLVRIRFGRWQEILAQPAPPEQFAHSQGMVHYARGRASSATGDAAGARAELERLRDVASRPELTTLKMEYNMSGDLLGIAERVLTGWTEAAAGRFAPAVEALREAVRREDALLYGEPPEWTVPARQDLGAVLLMAGRPAEAEQAFREDLAKFPENGWSLHGLAAALRAQGRNAEAEQAEADFRRVWETADVPPPEWAGP
jgi:tetratricopeptide (TPR) repeat protein